MHFFLNVRIVGDKATNALVAKSGTNYVNTCVQRGVKGTNETHVRLLKFSAYESRFFEDTINFVSNENTVFQESNHIEYWKIPISYEDALKLPPLVEQHAIDVWLRDTDLNFIVAKKEVMFKDIIKDGEYLCGWAWNLPVDAIREYIVNSGVFLYESTCHENVYHVVETIF